MEADTLRKPMRFRLGILAGIFGAGLLNGGQTWTVDAIMNLPTLGDPQISPNGKMLAYTRRVVENNSWVSSVYMAPIPSGEAKRIAKGSRPRWSPDSGKLAYLDSQVRVFDLERRTSTVATHAPSPVSTYVWWADGRSIGYLSVDPGPDPDPIVADQD